MVVLKHKEDEMLRTVENEREGEQERGEEQRKEERIEMEKEAAREWEKTKVRNQVCGRV